MRTKPTVDIIEDFVKSMTYTESIESCNVVDGEVFITVCDTHGLVNLGLIEIDSVSTKVLRVEDSSVIVIKGTQCPVVNEIVIPAPNYYHGTLKATDSELSTVKDDRLKTPMVYVFEVLQEKRNKNPQLSLGRSVDLIIFFLEDDEVGGQLTDDRYQDYIVPMTNSAEDLIDKFIESPLIAQSVEDDEYIIIPHTKAGFYDREGHVKNIFSMPLSGVEMRVTLPIEKEGCLECKN